MSNKENTPMEIDFSRKETESGWYRIMDNFGRKATPVWFNWIGWILLLGALHYLFKMSHSVILGIAIAISAWLLWLYFQAFFFGLRFKSVPLLRWVRHERLISFVLSAIMAFLFWNVAVHIAMIVLKYQS